LSCSSPWSRRAPHTSPAALCLPLYLEHGHFLSHPSWRHAPHTFSTTSCLPLYPWHTATHRAGIVCRLLCKCPCSNARVRDMCQYVYAGKAVHKGVVVKPAARVPRLFYAVSYGLATRTRVTSRRTLSAPAQLCRMFLGVAARTLPACFWVCQITVCMHSGTDVHQAL